MRKSKLGVPRLIEQDVQAALCIISDPEVVLPGGDGAVFDEDEALIIRTEQSNYKMWLEKLPGKYTKQNIEKPKEKHINHWIMGALGLFIFAAGIVVGSFAMFVAKI